MQNTTTTKTRTTKKLTQKPLLAPGHRACAGCGQLIAARTVINAIGPDVIVANATGCLEVTTTPYPESSWGVPFIHSLFENAPAVATGVLAALRAKGTPPPTPLSKGGKIKVLAQGGDGSTFDIGFGPLSGMWERGDDIIYVVYDNEAYANTGMQASGATIGGSNTSTGPAGLENKIGTINKKKDMIAIALAHGVRYVAQTTAGFLGDIEAKVKRAMEIEGPAYIQILSPCVPGWGINPNQAIKIGKIAAQTGLYPCIEFTDGQLTKKMNVPTETPKVEEYLKTQSRFAHLFKTPEGKVQIAELQRIADENIKKYMLK